VRLEEFRVQNYKKIRDTGWVSCRDLTVFVGKNEAGKSAIFRGLSKLNPSDGEAYDGLKEFPRRRYSDEFAAQDWPVASGRFALDEGGRQALVALCPLLQDIETVEVTRRYSGRLSVGFQPGPSNSVVTPQQLRDAIDQAIEQVQDLTAPRGKGTELGTIKQAALAALHQVREAIPASSNLTRAQITPAISAVTTHANEDWQKPLLTPAVVPLRALADRAAAADQLQAARDWVAKYLPKFIYFDNYDVIDSAIHVPTFASQLASTPNAPRVRTTNCLFQHVGLDVSKLAGLGRHQLGQEESEAVRRQVDERAILASSASNAMTEKFADWWEQRRHTFRYQFDGDYFRIWVSDDLDPSEIELDQRSVGMQYFFSFFTVFLVEAAGAHTGSILLLDEPGMHLHGTAQAAIVQFLDHLSKDNQTLYTTHSPFMVDVDHLERARAVYEDEDGTTRVSEDVWPRDKDSLFPLQAALGYQLAQGLFVSKRQVIVEGLTDLWLLKALDQALAARGRQHLRQDIILVPSAGVAKLLPLASMLIGHDVEVAALLDGDEPARKEGKKLVEKLLAGEDRKCLFIGDCTAHPGAELEDIFPEDEYLDAVRVAYPGVKLNFSADERALAGVVAKVESFFARRNLGRLEKWRVAAVLRDRIIDRPDTVADETLDIIEQIYANINGLLPAS
jgi:predicted ATPase